jgi:hypothetical protein
MKTIILAIALCLMSASSAAHLIAIGWEDLDNGTIRIYGQHWHGDQTSAYSDTGGVLVGGWDSLLSANDQDLSSWTLFQWTGFINNWGGNEAANDALVSNGELTGWAESSHWGNNSSNNDWFYTDPVVLGNGTWGLFTGTNCCVDTMSAPRQFTLTGIESVQDGTGPSTDAPEPHSIALFALGMISLVSIRRRRSNL